MESAVDIIVSLFSLLTSTTIFGISLLGWALIPVVVGLVFSFIKKDNKNNEKDN